MPGRSKVLSVFGTLNLENMAGWVIEYAPETDTITLELPIGDRESPKMKFVYNETSGTLVNSFFTLNVSKVDDQTLMMLINNIYGDQIRQSRQLGYDESTKARNLRGGAKMAKRGAAVGKGSPKKRKASPPSSPNRSAERDEYTVHIDFELEPKEYEQGAKTRKRLQQGMKLREGDSVQWTHFSSTRASADVHTRHADVVMFLYYTYFGDLDYNATAVRVKNYWVGNVRLEDQERQD
jgi:DNA-binding protein Fis